MKACLQCSKEFEGSKGLCPDCLSDDQMLASAGQNQPGRISASQFQSQASATFRTMKITVGSVLTLTAMLLGLLAPNGFIFLLALVLGIAGISLLINGLNSNSRNRSSLPTHSISE